MSVCQEYVKEVVPVSCFLFLVPSNESENNKMPEILNMKYGPIVGWRHGGRMNYCVDMYLALEDWDEG